MNRPIRRGITACTLTWFLCSLHYCLPYDGTITILHRPMMGTWSGEVSSSSTWEHGERIDGFLVHPRGLEPHYVSRRDAFAGVLTADTTESPIASNVSGSKVRVLVTGIVDNVDPFPLHGLALVPNTEFLGQPLSFESVYLTGEGNWYASGMNALGFTLNPIHGAAASDATEPWLEAELDMVSEETPQRLLPNLVPTPPSPKQPIDFDSNWRFHGRYRGGFDGKVCVDADTCLEIDGEVRVDIEVVPETLSRAESYQGVMTVFGEFLGTINGTENEIHFVGAASTLAAKPLLGEDPVIAKGLFSIPTLEENNGQLASAYFDLVLKPLDPDPNQDRIEFSLLGNSIELERYPDTYPDARVELDEVHGFTVTVVGDPQPPSPPPSSEPPEFPLGKPLLLNATYYDSNEPLVPRVHTPPSALPRIPIIPSEGPWPLPSERIRWEGNGASELAVHPVEPNDWTRVIWTPYVTGTHTIRVLCQSRWGRFRIAEQTIRVFAPGVPQPRIRQPLVALDTLTNAPQSVLLEGCAYDPEDREIGDTGLSWSSDVDGFLGTGSSILRTIPTPGPHRITLTATDSDGNSSDDHVFVDIQAYLGQSPPQLRLIDPGPPSCRLTAGAVRGQPRTFRVEAFDVEDGPQVGLEWFLQHTPQGAPPGPRQNVGSGPLLTLVIPDTSPQANEFYRLGVTATDGDGAERSISIEILATKPGHIVQ